MEALVIHVTLRLLLS